MAEAAPIPTVPAAVSEKRYRRRVFAWSWYDWANHAYVTTTASTFFPPYFIAIAAPAFLAAGKAAGDPTAAAAARDAASNVFAFTVSLALFAAALLAPLIGTCADITGRRKRILVLVTGAGGVLSSMMFTLTTGRWVLGLVLYFLTQVCVNIALGLNSSLLPHVARPGDLDRASSLGYAMGYVGGGLLLAFNAALYFFSGRLGLPPGLAPRIAFLTVGLWWIAFTAPLLFAVPEPPATPLAGGVGKPLRDSVVRLRRTLGDLRRYRDLFTMLVAYWFYMEGVGAIILLATAYGAALGLDTGVLIGMLLLTQFVAFPYALIYGRIPDASHRWRGATVAMVLWTGATLPLLGWYAHSQPGLALPRAFALIGADQALGVLFAMTLGRRLFALFAARLDAKRAVIMGLIIYTVVPLWGFVLSTPAEFFMLGWMVGAVQGGTQALSRSIYAELSPRAKSGEFFGIYGLFEKFSGILGPLLYGLVGELTGNPRDSVVSIAVFFVAGIWVLSRVDVPRGARAAREEETRIEGALAAD